MFEGRALHSGHPSVARASGRATVVLVAFAVAALGGLAGSAVAQQRPASAWTAEACRLEIERRGWKVDASETGDTGYADGWVWFRLVTDLSGTADALCGEATGGGVSLNVLAAATADSAGDPPGDLVGACGKELERRGWKRSGGASTARSSGTVLVQHVVTNESGTPGVGHCVYDDRPAAGPTSGPQAAPVATAVSAEVVRPEQTIDQACREVFALVGWSAVPVPGRADASQGRYEVTGKTGTTQRVICRYDRAAERVRVQVERH